MGRLFAGLATMTNSDAKLDRFPLVRYVPIPVTGGLDSITGALDSQWEESNLPDVYLESHHARCYYCYSEFDLPRSTSSPSAKQDAEYKPLRQLSCAHVFHKQCIDEWLEKHTECPLCRARVFDISPSESLSKPPLRLPVPMISSLPSSTSSIALLPRTPSSLASQHSGLSLPPALILPSASNAAVVVSPPQAASSSSRSSLVLPIPSPRASDSSPSLAAPVSLPPRLAAAPPTIQNRPPGRMHRFFSKVKRTVDPRPRLRGPAA
ncbi:hypothetical protein BJ138DRAFT_544375 [Hygrophoropsis aurantiaca]|uniref:Uncharacterized protein n=1 Tax=Hygrophoropsis aurantiaca TaxID=72124 RepID=A0ACB8A146_9AGAM|nr:hypothetical protein BJ138DRAFT_544375 [Hygrophoropsis aurantiaca]